MPYPKFPKEVFLEICQLYYTLMTNKKIYIHFLFTDETAFFTETMDTEDDNSRFR